METVEEGTVKTAVKCKNGSIPVINSAFTHIYMVPSHLVVHAPFVKSAATRAMFCRNYKRFEADSCAVGSNCRFVHADVDLGTLKAYAVHVNYTWRDEELCMYKRLPPGGFVEVLLPNSKPPAVKFPSECILATRGAYSVSKMKSQTLSHCAHYYFNYLCNRGEDCGFIHAVYVDPSISEVYKRATGRSHRHFVPYALKTSTGSAVNGDHKHRSRKEELTDVQPNLSMVGGVSKSDGTGEVLLSTLVGQGPNSWRGLNCSMEGSGEGPYSSSSGEEIAKEVEKWMNGDDALRTAPEVQHNGRPLDRRTCRVYRHDPYHSI
ncbi:hypothetical protein TraAM80_01023 [Trypanosoma rangeli]|uniref:C3H1-type domain-containing protein n=1 Tax=Trypanosoma rangeli TaxID=5698 RepID=A0A3S5ISH3_TRYRA|nr:uncharacterized protein TraAM80_01023 [Trypanosoma rangeli]RNF11235.1 hypothetical protein TraAM80_01023 [Trypanosoma rangeli]|eukprot:RNF11235.1 hypothetical protein TraAM80_01023 [Trypanosoma rangeli]